MCTDGSTGRGPSCWCGVSAAVGLTVLPLLACGQPAFYGVGALPPAPPASLAYGVSPDGAVVVGWSQIPVPPPLFGYGSESFRWTLAGGMAGLTVPSGFLFSTARGASTGGTFITGFHQVDTSTGHRAYRWSQGGGYEYLGDLPGGNEASAAYDISSDGRTIVGIGNYTSAPTTAYGQAFIWREGLGMTGLGALPGAAVDSQAHGVSADGTVVAGSARPAGGMLYQFVPIRWTSAGGMQAIGLLPGGATGLAWDISADGHVIVGVSGSSSGSQAFRWVEGQGMTGLGDLPGGVFASSAYSVNADGTVIAGLADSGSGNNGDEAFIWTPWDGMRSLTQVLTQQYGLNLTGWHLLEPFGMSDDGRVIVGLGVHPDNRIEGWVAVLPCYADCNYDNAFTIADFACFQARFVAAEPYADCNHDGQRTIADFACFQSRFAGELCP